MTAIPPTQAAAIKTLLLVRTRETALSSLGKENLATETSRARALPPRPQTRIRTRPIPASLELLKRRGLARVLTLSTLGLEPNPHRARERLNEPHRGTMGIIYCQYSSIDAIHLGPPSNVFIAMVLALETQRILQMLPMSLQA